MSINAASTTTTSTVASTASNVSSSEGSKKSSADSSFKDEMNKVSDKEQSSNEKLENKSTESKDKTSKSEAQDKNDKKDDDLLLEGSADYSKYASMSVIDVNSMLASDIRQMMGVNTLSYTDEISNVQNFMTLDFKNSVSVTASDAEFFIGLTQNNDVSMQNIVSQAQVMLNNGADISEVKQNVQISRTLLNALNAAKENNQPLRIDFDQNVSVILRVGKDGAIAATFIPGDKAVEQYLKNNISSLRAAFEENELPYTDLSYSNRGSKQQKENRKNNNK